MKAVRREATNSGGGPPRAPNASPSAHGSWPSSLRSALVLLLAIVAGAIAIAYALPGGVTLGAGHTDMVGQFIAWRAFAAESIRGGDFPFWNPFVYSGQPFLGGFQSALLYPPNAIFLMFPLERALSISVVLHVAIVGLGVAWWARQRGHHPAAAALAGVTMAFSGVVFPHVYAGHLSNLCTMAWAPWMFGGLEHWARERRPRGLALAAAAIALQVLAGQVQYVFLLAVAAGVWALVVSAFERGVRSRALIGVVIAGAFGAVLAAAQLLPGWEAAEEGVRHGRLDYGFASSFALPPENLLTLIVPGFFGDLGTHPYWGRCYLWEMSVHVGVIALAGTVLAVCARQTRRAAATDLVVAGLLLLLALGRHLPLHAFLYEHVPGFGQFRGMSKFTFPAVLFLTLSSAAGLDGVIRGQARMRRIGFGIGATGIVLGAVALLLWVQPGIVRRVFDWIAADAHADSLIAPPKFSTGAGTQAARAVAQAAMFALLAGASLWLSVRRPAWRWVAVAILPVECALFARGHFATVPIAAAMPDELRGFVARSPGDYRVLNLARPNNGFLLGAPDLWGNDPGVLKRYAEFMTFTQGGKPDAATQNLAFARIPPIYAMLRCRYAFVPSGNGIQVVDVPNPLPRALLVSKHRVISGRDAILDQLIAPSFNPRQTVLLENEPVPRPVPGGTGTVQVTASTADTVTIEAEVSAPSLLLVTELHSRGWRVRSLPGSTQAAYEVLPANYVLQAVPLDAGHHRLQFEYRPRTFFLGLWLSAAGCIALAAFGSGPWWRRFRFRPDPVSVVTG